MAVVGYVPGGFDMFHIGHLNVLEASKDRCDTLIAGVVTDELLLSVKGRRPVVPHEERIAIVSAIGCVDEVITDDSSDKRRAWYTRKFDVLFKGDDWQGTPKGDQLEAQMADIGVRVVYLPYTPHTSSTMLREFLTTGQPVGRK